MSFDHRWETDIYSKSEQQNKYPFDQIVSTTFRFFGRAERSKVKVLELGSGTGNNLAFLASEGFDATGIEGSEHAVLQSRNFLQSKNLQANVVCGDFSDLSAYENESFDYVIDRGSITHNHRASIVKIIQEVKRVLKKDGVFVSHMFSSAHGGMKYGNRQQDGSYLGFSDGMLKNYQFVFYFASPEDTQEFFDQNFQVLSKSHQVNTECTVEDDVRAMWWVICKKQK